MNRAQRRAAARRGCVHHHVEVLCPPSRCPWCSGTIEYPGQAQWLVRMEALTGERLPRYDDVPDAALWWCQGCGDGDMWTPDDLLVLT